MLCVDFEGTNVVLDKPDNMKDEDCYSIRAFQGIDEGGFPYFLSCWQPSVEDIQAIKAGQPIFLKMLGTGFQPSCLFTIDENNNVNA